MNLAKTLLLSLALASVSAPASAQIISQNPKPKVKTDQQTEIETINRREQVGRPSTLIKIPRNGAFLFAGFDENHDYIIDTTEVSLGITTAFARADKDGSGTLSLVELEGWRLAALGSNHASPSNYDFAPNFARTVDPAKFAEVLQKLAAKLDTDDQGERDGKIAITDLVKDFKPPRQKTDDSTCQARVREARRESEKQCRVNR